MKKILQKFISFFLIIILFLWSSLSSFWYSENFYKDTFWLKETINTDIELREKYHIKQEIDTSYWKVYLLVDKEKAKNIYEERAVWVWDLVDIWMAVSSWAKLFWEPSWENAWWAILDTVSLTPLIPSIRWLKNVNQVLEKIKEYASKSKRNFENVLKHFKTWREYIRKIYINRLFPKLNTFSYNKNNR